jgi:hypothetical protein
MRLDVRDLVLIFATLDASWAMFAAVRGTEKTMPAQAVAGKPV